MSPNVPAALCVGDIDDRLGEAPIRDSIGCNQEFPGKRAV